MSWTGGEEKKVPDWRREFGHSRQIVLLVWAHRIHI